MRIQELLNDDDLYELCVLMNEMMWTALMAYSLPRDVHEGYRIQGIRRPARKVIRPPMVPVKPFPRPKPLYPQKTKVSPAQRMATIPKIDPLMGFNARLDNQNVFPEVTDKEVEIEMKGRPKFRR